MNAFFIWTLDSKLFSFSFMLLRLFIPKGLRLKIFVHSFFVHNEIQISDTSFFVHIRTCTFTKTKLFEKGSFTRNPWSGKCKKINQDTTTVVLSLHHFKKLETKSINQQKKHVRPRKRRQRIRKGRSEASSQGPP